MPAKSSLPAIPLPRAWPSRVKSAILHVISLAQFSLAYTRGWAANSPNSRIRLKAELDRALQEITLLREALCPMLGKVKIAQILARAGLHIGATTIGRILKEKPAPKPTTARQGPQFTCKNFKPWCRRKGIRPRFGAIGEHGSIAVIERLILTLKQGIAWLTLVPLRRRAFLRELRYLAAWYNSHRPHMTLGGRTPDEVYHRLRPMNRQPRFEPRTHWPRSSSCAKPVTLVKGKPGVRLTCEITFQGKRRHLPVVTLNRAA